MQKRRNPETTRRWYWRTRPARLRYHKAWRIRNYKRVVALERRRRKKNRVHILAQQRKWKARNKVRLLAYHLKQRFRMSLVEYQALLKRQKGRCAICKRRYAHQRLGVDHNHRTKKVRGLLCDCCNRGLGYFKDSPAFLRTAAKYLGR